MPTNLRADLYSIGNTATVVTEGFAFQTTNEACLARVDGEIKATKFGLYRIGPSTVKHVKSEADEHGEELFDRIVKDVQMRIYRSDTHYLPTSIQRVHAGDDQYAVYDTESRIIYSVLFDENEQGTYNLVGKSRNTIRKLSTNSLKSELGSRYYPIVKIESKK